MYKTDTDGKKYLFINSVKSQSTVSNDIKTRTFYKQVSKDNHKEVKKLLGKNIFYLRKNNDLALKICASNNLFETLKVLVNNGYFFLKEQSPQFILDTIFIEPFIKASVNGNIDIVKFLFPFIDLCLIKDTMKNIMMFNYNYSINYKLSSDSNYESTITTIKSKVSANNNYNKIFNKNKVASISIFEECLINEHDYDVPENVSSDDENDENDENEIDTEVIEDIDNEDEIEIVEENECNENEVVEENEVEIELDLKKPKKKIYKCKLMEKFKNKDKNHFMKYEPANMSKTLEVIFWLITNDIFVKTSYEFISIYCSNHSLFNIIKILKENNKYIEDNTSKKYIQGNNDLFGDSEENTDSDSDIE